MLVNYTIPMSLPKLKEEKNPVLDIVHYAGAVEDLNSDLLCVRPGNNPLAHTPKTLDGVTSSLAR